MQKADHNGTEITFDDLQVEEVDRVEHSIYYTCNGSDANGNKYTGVAHYCCDEFEEITDIEKI